MKTKITDKTKSRIAEFFCILAWAAILNFLCWDVPAPWRCPVVLAVFYLSRISAHMTDVANAARVIKEN